MANPIAYALFGITQVDSMQALLQIRYQKSFFYDSWNAILYAK